MEKVMKNRFLIITIFFVCMFIIIITKLSFMQLTNVKASVKQLDKLSIKYAYGEQMPRGKIYDRNYNVIVDNVGVNKLVYEKQKGIKELDEVKIAYLVAKNIDISISRLTDKMIKDFWIVNNEEKADKKIRKSEYELYKRRKMKYIDLENLKRKRITKKELSEYKDIDKAAAYVYYLMNNGYSYETKTIKEELADEEYSYIIENKDIIPGMSVITSWKRIYPYGETLRQILGNVSTGEQGIPLDKKEVYLSKGYSLNDRVGLSYLEYQYDDDLKGTKDVYEVKNGRKKLIKKGKKGDDVVLSIDINLQKEVEKILEEEIIAAKNEPNTDIYNSSSVIITDPKTGQILALASKQLVNSNGEYKIRDYTTSLLTISNPPGSVVKGASMLVGYKTGNLKFGDTFYDKCIKFKNTPKKCSWSNNLGTLNDVTALKYSSNSYQFQLALKVAGVNYYYNMPIKVDSSALDTYKSFFKELGLGSKTGIDLPNETEGYKGKESNAGLLLNYVIGQYDSYTLFQVNSYLNTIINDGERLKLSLLKEVRESTNNNELGKVKQTYTRTVLNKINMDKIYFDRVKEGFKEVMSGYLGSGYMGNLKNTAGKTGTSETFYDSDGDGRIDTETYSKSFMGYYPYDDPAISIVVQSPHVRIKKQSSSYASNVNKRITSRICNIFFEIYK